MQWRSMVLAAVVAVVTAMPAAAQARGAAKPAAAPTKVGYVNFQGVLASAPGYAQAESLFVAERGKLGELLKAIDDSATAAQKAFETRAASLPPAQAQSEREALVKKGEAWQARADTLQARLQAKERELLAPVQQRTLQALEAVRKEGGYAVVFDVSAQANAIIVADSTADLSVRVVKKLQAAAPKN